jgi:hypothetical protein
MMKAEIEFPEETNIDEGLRYSSKFFSDQISTLFHTNRRRNNKEKRIELQKKR